MRGLISARTDIIDTCESTCGYWKMNLGLLEEQSIFLTTELSLQPPTRRNGWICQEKRKKMCFIPRFMHARQAPQPSIASSKVSMGPPGSAPGKDVGWLFSGPLNIVTPTALRCNQLPDSSKPNIKPRSFKSASHPLFQNLGKQGKCSTTELQSHLQKDFLF